MNPRSFRIEILTFEQQIVRLFRHVSAPITCPRQRWQKPLGIQPGQSKVKLPLSGVSVIKA